MKPRKHARAKHTPAADSFSFDRTDVNVGRTSVEVETDPDRATDSSAHRSLNVTVINPAIDTSCGVLTADNGFVFECDDVNVLREIATAFMAAADAVSERHRVSPKVRLQSA